MTTAEAEVLDQDTLQIVSATPLEQLNRAEIDVQISTAKKYPRDIRTFKKRAISMATLDEETAGACLYSLPRGGRNIAGPSVRLAEIAVSNYQNMRAGVRIIGEDGEWVTSQAVAHDLENNICISVEVRRRVLKRKSRKNEYDADAVALAGAAGSSIALRNAVFRVIPRAFINEIYSAARDTAIGNASTLKDKRAKCLDAFAKMGVREDRIFPSLGVKSVEDIGLDELEKLRGLYTAIKDGDTTIDDAFPDPSEAKPAADDRPKSGTDAVKEALKSKAAKPTEPPQAGNIEALRKRLSELTLSMDKGALQAQLAGHEFESLQQAKACESPERLARLIDDLEGVNAAHA